MMKKTVTKEWKTVEIGFYTDYQLKFLKNKTKPRKIKIETFVKEE